MRLENWILNTYSHDYITVWTTIPKTNQPTKPPQATSLHFYFILDAFFRSCFSLKNLFFDRKSFPLKGNKFLCQEIISFDGKSFTLTGNHFCWQESISFDMKRFLWQEINSFDRKSFFFDKKPIFWQKLILLDISFNRK